MNWTALIVFILLFGFITVIGFVAANWRRGDLDLLHEWGLAGRRLGTVVTWFLLGGDVYTAYTFVAVPALVFGAGAIGFFALPYTIIVYPLVFLILPRMWSVTHTHNYITAADFVQGRYGNRWLALAVAITGIVATMPYIALQLLGLQVVIGAMGVGASGGLAGDLPLIIAFVILAAFTYTSGLRAPAMIAVVKDTLIYITVIAMVIVVPIEVGGYDKIFAVVPPAKLLLPAPGPNTLGQYSAYATLAQEHFRWIKGEIDAGRFGRLVQAEANISRDRLGKIDLSSWRYQSAGMPGGVMLQIGIHYVDVLEMLMGKVVRVSGRSAQLVLPGDNPDVANLILEHENGALSNLTASYASASEYYMMNIYGKEASAYYDLFSGLRVLRRGETSVTPVKVAANDTIREELEEFVHCIRSGTPPETDGWWAARNLAVIKAGVRSAREGRAVAVDEILASGE